MLGRCQLHAPNAVPQSGRSVSIKNFLVHFRWMAINLVSGVGAIILGLVTKFKLSQHSNSSKLLLAHFTTYMFRASENLNIKVLPRFN